MTDFNIVHSNNNGLAISDPLLMSDTLPIDVSSNVSRGHASECKEVRSERKLTEEHNTTYSPTKIDCSYQGESDFTPGNDSKSQKYAFRSPYSDLSKGLDKISFKNDSSGQSYVSFKAGLRSKIGIESNYHNIKSKNTSSLSDISKIFSKKPGTSFSGQSIRQVSPNKTKAHEATAFSESNEGGQHTEVKTKLKSIWNNMKYGWKMKREVNLKADSAIWLLGQCYHNKLNESSAVSQDVTEQLKQDFMSKIWLTYRINFPAIPGTNLVSDSGWGCMLRSGQMMMAQAFVCHFLQRNWRLSCSQTETGDQMYKTILRWFGDSLSEKSPFSLHRLVSLGESYGRKAGDWYGPTHAAHVLRDALLEAQKHISLLRTLCMYVASDGIVFKQDVIDLFTGTKDQEKKNTLADSGADSGFLSSEPLSQKEPLESNECFVKSCDIHLAGDGPTSFEESCPSYSSYGPPSYSSINLHSKSLIMFVSVRLGNEKINPFYVPCLKSLLAYEHCIGIIGGRPKHALYFIGWQDDKIIHMDPHSCQPAINVEQEDFCGKSFHSSSIRTMSFSEMDPSCAIGFYFRELQEFQLFIEKFSEITAPLKKNLEYPVFALAEGKRDDIEDHLDQPYENCVYTSINSSCYSNDDDDYILL